MDSPGPSKSLNGVRINDVKIIKNIGSGSYGHVYLVEDIQTGEKYAAKLILQDLKYYLTENPSIKEIERVIESFFKENEAIDAESISLDYIKSKGLNCPAAIEIKIQLMVHEHKNIGTIYKVFDITDFGYIFLMDYFEDGDLFEYMINNGLFDNVPINQNKQLLMKNCMLQLIDAIEFCHRKSVYHCDIKLENIMVRYNPNYTRKNSDTIIDYDELHIVLIDFGLATQESLMRSDTYRGSSYYMAPERVFNYNKNNIIKILTGITTHKGKSCENRYKNHRSEALYLPTAAGDIWSLGILFINIISKKNPWPIASLNNTPNAIPFKEYVLQGEDYFHSYFSISNNFSVLLDKILQLDPSKRIGLLTLYDEIVNCELFIDPIESSNIDQLPSAKIKYNFGSNEECNINYSFSSNEECNIKCNFGSNKERNIKYNFGSNEECNIKYTDKDEWSKLSIRSASNSIHYFRVN